MLYLTVTIVLLLLGQAALASRAYASSDRVVPMGGNRLAHVARAEQEPMAKLSFVRVAENIFVGDYAVAKDLIFSIQPNDIPGVLFAQKLRQDSFHGRDLLRGDITRRNWWPAKGQTGSHWPSDGMNLHSDLVPNVLGWGAAGINEIWMMRKMHPNLFVLAANVSSANRHVRSQLAFGGPITSGILQNGIPSNRNRCYRFCGSPHPLWYVGWAFLAAIIAFGALALRK